jgi:hypothetical protein
MKNWIKRGIAVHLFITLSTGVQGQDDLLELLNAQEEPETNYTIATFKSTRLVSGHSVETNKKGDLQFLIGHRFGRINSGWRELYGIDNATIRFGFEYGLTDNLNIGIGRSSFQKTYDGNIKWRFLRQKYGAEEFPLSATWVSTMYVLANEFPNTERENYFNQRLSFNHTLLLARKFGKLFSLQLMPTVMHRNLVATEQDENTVFAMGAGTSIRLTGSVRFNVEYHYIFPNQIASPVGGEDVTNALSLGVDLETGGHVFQLHITNSRGMTEKYLVGETTGIWGDGDIHFGFNVSRVFTTKKHKKVP